MEQFIKFLVNNEALFSAVTVVIGFFSIFIAGLTRLLMDREKEKAQFEREKARERLVSAQRELVQEVASRADIPERVMATYRAFLERELTDEDVEMLSRPYSPDPKEVEVRLETAIKPLQERLEQIEKRFPNSSTIDKIASINDAILATKIEQITQDIKRIEDKLLTKWDVALIVIEVLGVIGVVIGIIFGLLGLLTK